jgi:hypothetical protein
MLAEASGDVHHIAEIGDLPLRVATLADDDRPRMNAGAEPRRDSEFARIGRRKNCHRVLGREEAAQRSDIRVRVVAQRPRDDHLVADIGVHL